MAARIYLTGEIAIEHDGTFVGEQLPGRQGRIALAYLVSHRFSSVTRDDLIATIWGSEAPDEIDTALSAILSKLRGVLKKARLTGAAIDVRSGTITLRLPDSVHVDVEDATNSIDEAEGALRRSDDKGAWGHANVVVSVARRQFLRGEDAPWIEAERQRLRTLLARGLQVLTSVSRAKGEVDLALQYAMEIVALDPFRETGYQQLMRLHAEMGNRGEALRVFARLRELLRDELGTSPSPQTETLYMTILTA